jgi:hypothetical protein
MKTRFAEWRLKMSRCKLACCYLIFAFFGIVFFADSLITMTYTDYNAAHIAQTGHLPWVSPQPDFEPSEFSSPVQDYLWNIFMAQGFLKLFISGTMWMFAMRTIIAAALGREKNSNIAFRRTFYCIFAFLFFYGLLFREQGKLQEVYP